tara:strand:+ start:511 stop:831 length:321 start_codon:yes stop_codon:yes gene_type:complete
MTNNKIAFYLIFILLLQSCGTVKEGFKNQKKDNSDEFLVEKKFPLTMPPNYGELPVPNLEKNEAQQDEDKIKNLIITDEENIINNNGQKSESQNFEKSLLEKIKNN